MRPAEKVVEAEGKEELPLALEIEAQLFWEEEKVPNQRQEEVQLEKQMV